jgi:hypothetical protein
MMLGIGSAKPEVGAIRPPRISRRLSEAETHQILRAGFAEVGTTMFRPRSELADKASTVFRVGGVAWRIDSTVFLPRLRSLGKTVSQSV